MELGAVLVTALLLGATPTRAESGDGHQSNQGTRLHGTVDKRFERLGIPLASAWHKDFPGLSVTADAGQLKGAWSGGAVEGERLNGLRFSAAVEGKLVTFTVVRGVAHVNVYTGGLSRTVWQYEVQWQSSAGQGNLCPDKAPALVLPGRWDANVYVYTDPDFFSFACMPVKDGGVVFKGGVAAKCVDWGYPPWVPEVQMPGSEEKSPARTLIEATRYHVACTAMASADYCGEAISNTIDGTEIVMFNDRNVRTQLLPGDSSTRYVSAGPFGTTQDFLFESAWTVIPQLANGGVGDFPAMRAKAACLSKKRWSTLPLGGSCTGELPDPRQDKPAPFCDDIPVERLRDDGAVLFSYSRYIDAGLYRFRHQSFPNQTLTTASIVIDPQTGKYRPRVQGAGEYELDYRGDDASAFEGLILTKPVPAFPGMQSTLPLWRYYLEDEEGHRRFVMLRDDMKPPEGYQLDKDNDSGGLEGYVYVAPQPPGNKPTRVLRQWEAAPGEYAASSEELTPWGYGITDTMGYLPMLSDYAQLP
jgi:hypothetical protein